MIAERLRSLKETFAREKEVLDKRFLRERDSEGYLRDHTGLVDSLVKAVVEPHRQRSDLAVFATGGYGRKELFPASDVDLLLVFGSDEKAESSVSRVVHELWDTGLEIGHQVWSIEQLDDLSLKQYQFVLALLDLRLLGSPNRLSDRFERELLPSFLKDQRDAIISKIVEIVSSRHAEYGNTIYQLEPDLKSSPGGLRDLQVGRWLLKLQVLPTYLAHDERETLIAEEFLKRVRILLHLLNGRNDNRLTHRLQEKIRRYVGYRSASAQSGVESLMKEYFLNARISQSFCRSMLRAVEPVHPSIEGQPAFQSMHDLLEIFRTAGEQGFTLSDQTRNAVVESLPRLSDVLNFPSLRDSVISLFRPKPGLYKSLSEMYELGVLELLFPEFGTIKARVVRDFYHRYTVDEHTLLAIRTIEKLSDEKSGEDGRFKTLLQDTVEPILLTLALLLHDVGKGRGGQHSERGARMAARALRRFRFAPQQINTVAFLIQHHLSMSAVVFRRDLEDERVVRRFADLVGNPEILRLLTLLTYADIKAVAPGTLNDWKKDLLWQLYVATYRKLTLEYGDERVEEDDVRRQLLLKRDSDINREGLEEFVQGFPARYLRNTPPREIFEHFRMAQRLDVENLVQTRLSRHKAHYDLWVVTPDRPYLFAKLVGLLSYFEMNILRGHAFGNKGRTILDFFQFLDSAGHFRRIHEKTRFQELLKQAIQEKVSVEKLLQSKEESILFQRSAPRFTPTVYFEDEQSDRFTILEIIAPDALGLLYRISREIAALDCDIDLALISTEGEKAVDVFYLCYRGSKLSSELQQNLSERILRAIN